MPIFLSLLNFPLLFAPFLPFSYTSESRSFLYHMTSFLLQCLFLHVSSCLFFRFFFLSLTSPPFSLSFFFPSSVSRPPCQLLPFFLSLFNMTPILDFLILHPFASQSRSSFYRIAISLLQSPGHQQEWRWLWCAPRQWWCPGYPPWTATGVSSPTSSRCGAGKWRWGQTRRKSVLVVTR